MTTTIILALALVSIGLSLVAWRSRDTVLWQFVLPDIPKSDTPPQFEQVFEYIAPTGQAHSPAILVEEGGFSILWFEGSAEAQADVDIHAARFANTQQGWQSSAPAALVSRQKLSQVFDPEQLVVTLGNTVENHAVPQGIFATVVSVGGWAMASVADVRLGHGAAQYARKLNLSPFLNRSYLVKSPMVEMADGSSALPAYFEMGSTYGAFVRLASDGRVCDQRRMAGHGSKPIQPMVVPLDATRAVAFLRDFDPSGQLLISHTSDGGQNWSVAAPSGLPNPSAPVAALPVGGGRILMAMNDDPGGAHSLSLAVSSDEGVSWQVIHTLEQNAGDARYPMLRRLSDGTVVLTYSCDTKRGVRAYVFNQAWIDAQ
ncbi:MAG: exo-alpha-sialidase [Roseovarius sp.]